jgi:thioredoxin-like negative regulator of GroEL
VFVGLIVVVFHGLVDDAFYAGQAGPLLFLLPAFVVALVSTGKSQERIPIPFSPKKGSSQRKIYPISATQFRRLRLPATGLVALALIGLFAVSGKPILARVYSNLGAVRMAREELVGYPNGRWDADRNREVNESQPVQAALFSFNQSIQLDPDNVTARYRMGLIEIGKGDLQAALLQLKRANELAPAHRGIRKVLGYIYTWTGQLDPALELLVQVPEAQMKCRPIAGGGRSRARRSIAAFNRNGLPSG